VKRHERINRGIYSTINTTVDTLNAPCTLAPAFWDAPRKASGGGYKPGEMSRAREAAGECLPCPALEGCLRFVAGWSFPDGVVAGQIWVGGKRVDRVTS
jgi:hypothetical protein